MSHTRQLLQTSRPKQSKRVRKLKGNLRQLTEQLDLTSNRQGSVESEFEGLTNQETRWWTAL